MSDLTSMVNIGREMSRKLRAVGITSPEQLREAGAMGAMMTGSGSGVYGIFRQDTKITADLKGGFVWTDEK